MNKKLTKQEMERLLMTDFGLTREKAKAIVTALLSSISDTLVDGGKVLLKGVGTLEVKDTPERVHNGFGKQFKVEAKKQIDFTISDNLDDRLNNAEAVGLTDLLATLRKKSSE